MFAVVWNSRCLFWMPVSMMVHMVSFSSRTSHRVSRSIFLPLSIRAISSTLLMRDSKKPLASLIFCR